MVQELFVYNKRMDRSSHNSREGTKEEQVNRIFIVQ